MGENSYFQKALSDFTYEAAIGGAVRHLADSGYTVRQIVERLDFPTSFERVQKAVWEHLVRQGVILLEPPGNGGSREKVTYVREYDRYGKASFRRVVVREESEETACWAAHVLVSAGKSGEEGFSVADFIARMHDRENVGGGDSAYVSFDFGLVSRKEPARYEAMLEALDAHQREYVIGLPWEGRRVYHRLDLHGRELLRQLGEAGQYRGECYYR